MAVDAWIFASALMMCYVLGMASGMALLAACHGQLWERLRLFSWAALRFWSRQVAPSTLWKMSEKAWEEHVSEDETLCFLHGRCENCAWWDGSGGEGYAARLHAAMDHVWWTRDGVRMGADRLDRWCSTTGSAAVALLGCAEGQRLHRLALLTCGTSADPLAAAVLDLRWLALDVPFLDDQCSSCRACNGADVLDAEAAGYTRQWGVWLQEVLLDRRQLRQTVVELCDGRMRLPPLQDYELALRVAKDCYRRGEARFFMRGWPAWEDWTAPVFERCLDRRLCALLEQ